MTSVDVEREDAYKKAEDINSQLDSMGGTLRDLAKRLNDSQEASVDKNNPVRQDKRREEQRVANL